MSTLSSIIHFYMHVAIFKIRDIIAPRIDVVKEAGIKTGSCGLDYRCGPGSYTALRSKMAGAEGRVYAVDAHPRAVKKVKDIIAAHRLRNVETVCSGCETGLSDHSVDLVLLYDVLHAVVNKDNVLRELHRILKPGGRLSFQDHRMDAKKTMFWLTQRFPFRLLKREKHTYTFQK